MMKVKRVIKLARVRYGDLDEGDEFLLPRIVGSPLIASKDGQILGHLLLDEVPALDTTRYPPESVTYTIEEIDVDDIQDAMSSRGAMYFPDNFFDEITEEYI